MVYMLLIMMLIMSIIGMMLYGVQQLEGPLATVVPAIWEDPLLQIHKTIAGILITLACIHIFGVLWASWWHRQNYILAMFTGMKSAHARRAKRLSDDEYRNLVKQNERLAKKTSNES